ncbi:MAG: NADPH-dependent FMN reductase [Anaerolineae bacterium]
MTTSIHVLGFAGSLRKGSYNRAILRAASELLPAGMSLEIFDLSPIPLYNADVEAMGEPEPVQEFKARIRAADALLIATPEYNYSITGVLKNALDWASHPSKNSPLNRKPVAIMGAGGTFGTVRAQQHLRLIAVHNDMRVLNKPEVYISRPGEKFDGDGHLADEPTRRRILALLEALAAWTRRL